VKKLILLLFVSTLIFQNLFSQKVVIRDNKFYNADGSLFTGTYKTYWDDDKKVKEEDPIQYGLLDGTSVLYFESGVKNEERSYSKGQKDGLWITWDENGNKTAEARFKEGKKDDFWYIWDEKGTLRYKMFYIKGQKKGNWTIWDETGKITSEHDFK